jgi:ElaB/YqjD/DUF883 family membrane-anchored ribosome-binding protein
MNRAGETLEQVAQAIRDTGNQIRQQSPEIAGIADTGAQRVDDLSMYLRQHDARDILDDAEQFARRQPALVLGGGLVVGLVLGRLLRSGAEPQTGDDRRWSGYASRSAWTGSDSGAAGWAGSSSTPGSGYGSSYGTDYGSGYAGASTPGTVGTADELGYTDAVADQSTSGSLGSTGESTTASRRSTSSTPDSTSSTGTRRKPNTSGS